MNIRIQYRAQYLDLTAVAEKKAKGYDNWKNNTPATHYDKILNYMMEWEESVGRDFLTFFQCCVSVNISYRSVSPDP